MLPGQGFLRLHRMLLPARRDQGTVERTLQESWMVRGCPVFSMVCWNQIFENDRVLSMAHTAMTTHNHDFDV